MNINSLYVPTPIVSCVDIHSPPTYARAGGVLQVTMIALPGVVCGWPTTFFCDFAVSCTVNNVSAPPGGLQFSNPIEPPPSDNTYNVVFSFPAQGASVFWPPGVAIGEPGEGYRYGCEGAGALTQLGYNLLGCLIPGSLQDTRNRQRELSCEEKLKLRAGGA